MSKSSTKAKSIKVYHMMYVQQMKYLPAGTVDNLIQLVKTRLHPQEYGLIVHDKDAGEEPHIHCMMSFQNARSIRNVAKLLGDNEERIEKWDDKPNNGFAYLIHATEKARSEGKYQYDPSEVHANFDYNARIEEIKAEIAAAKTEHNSSKKADELLDLLYVGAITRKEVEQQLSGAQYAQYHKKIEDVWAKRLQNMAEAWRAEKRAQNAEIKTIWIYGPAGTGKTSLAKESARRKGEDYYMSGSSRDIFQNYSGEHTLILDELRPNIIPYSDLLRITDPHGIENQVMAPSRYSDKALACDLIIITSPYNPRKFFAEMFGGYIRWDSVDKFDQLQRRILLTVKMTDTYIVRAEYDPLNKNYEEDPETVHHNPYSTVNRPPSVVAKTDIYSMLLGDSPTAPAAEEENGSVAGEEAPNQITPPQGRTAENEFKEG